MAPAIGPPSGLPSGPPSGPQGFVWLASYPKSGNTWMRLMLASLMAGGAAPGLAGGHRHLPAPLAGNLLDMGTELDVDAEELTLAERDALLPDSLLLTAQQGGLLFRKVHDGWGRTATGRWRLPPEVAHAAIHIVRDPRDVAISWAHHAGLDIDRAIAVLADPGHVIGKPRPHPVHTAPQPIGSWSGHAAGWLSARPVPLLLRYEDMLADPAACLRRVAAHCGLPAAEAAVAGAVAGTRFDRLRSVEAVTGFNGGQVRGQAFFRRGVAGGWRDSLTPAQAARIGRDHGEMMERLGYG